MGIGASIFLIALGAILAFAVNLHSSGVNIQVVGVILMAAGALGLIVSLVFLAPWRRTPPPSDGVYEERVYRDRNVY